MASSPARLSKQPTLTSMLGIDAAAQALGLAQEDSALKPAKPMNQPPPSPNILEKSLSSIGQFVQDASKVIIPSGDEPTMRERRRSAASVESARDAERARLLTEAEEKEAATQKEREEVRGRVDEAAEEERQRRLSEASAKEADATLDATLQRAESKKLVAQQAEEERSRRLSAEADGREALERERKLNQQMADAAMETERRRRIEEGPESPEHVAEEVRQRRQSMAMADEQMEAERRRRTGEEMEVEEMASAHRRKSIEQATLAMELERVRRVGGNGTKPAAAKTTSTLAPSLVFAVTALALAMLVALTFEEHTKALVEHVYTMLTPPPPTPTMPSTPLPMHPSKAPLDSKGFGLFPR